MIISISGRKSSGKTTLTNELLNRGFEKLSFASNLKEYISSIYKVPVEYLYCNYEKEKILEVPLEFSIKETQLLSDLVGEQIPHYRDYTFSSLREALQIIGTDILRTYDKDFHVKKTLSKIDVSKNYCIDDCRFISEKTILESLDAICIFLMRPSNFNYSNHESEIDLNWNMFEYVLINNKSEKTLIKKINSFLYGLQVKNPPFDRKYLKSKLIEYNYNTTNLANSLNCSRDKIVWWAERYLIDLSKSNNKYVYDDTCFLYPDKSSAYYAGLISADGCIKKSGVSTTSFVVELASNDIEIVEGFKQYLKSDKIIYNKVRINNDNGYYFTCNSNYIIENLKLWNIEPRKSKYNKVPDIIKNNKELVDIWLMGLIDGDGCICYRKQEYLNISIRLLASEEIIDFLIDTYKHIGLKKYNEKNISNLYTFNITGKKAIQLFEEIYDENFGLNRKWDKMKEFIKIKTAKNTKIVSIKDSL